MHASIGCRRAPPRHPDQTGYTTAAGSRCVTSRQLGTADGRREGQLSDNAARSMLPASNTAPPPPSRPETRRASCASSSLQSPATQSSAAHPSVPSESRAECAMLLAVVQKFPNQQPLHGFEFCFHAESPLCAILTECREKGEHQQ